MKCVFFYVKVCKGYRLLKSFIDTWFLVLCIKILLNILLLYFLVNGKNLRAVIRMNSVYPLADWHRQLDRFDKLRTL